MTAVGIFCIVTGVVMIGWWCWAFANHPVEELSTKPREIATHVSAEAVAAAALVASGVSLLAHSGRNARVASAFALGMLAYSAINSSGYFFQRRQWGPVGMFVVILAAAISGLGLLLTA
jgi:ADP-ribosylglycohydrolase